MANPIVTFYMARVA